MTTLSVYFAPSPQLGTTMRRCFWLLLFASMFIASDYVKAECWPDGSGLDYPDGHSCEMDEDCCSGVCDTGLGMCVGDSWTPPAPTPTPVVATFTPTHTATSMATTTPTVFPTNTPTPTASASATPTFNFARHRLLIEGKEDPHRGGQ